MKPLIIQMSLTQMWGGAEIFELNFTRQLIKDGYRVHFICRKGSPIESRMSAEGVEVTAIEARKYFDPAASITLHRLFKKLEPSTIVYHAFSDLWLTTPALIGLQKKPKQIGLIHTFVEKRKRDPFHNFIYSHLDNVICTTNLQAEALKKCIAVPNEKFEVIPYFIDCDRFTPSKRSDEIRRNFLPNGEGILIGCFGRLEKSKGQTDLLSAFNSIRTRTNQPLKLIFVGGDSTHEPLVRQQLKGEAARLGISNDVELIPFQDNIADLMASLDIFVMPSHKEAFGIVLIEALASGTPAISTDAGGVPDILDHGQTGLLAKPKDEKDLSEKLLSLIEDDSTRSILKIKSREKAEAVYSIGSVMKKWEALFRS